MKGFVRSFVAIFLVLSLLPAAARESTWQELITQGDRNINEQKLIEAEGCFREALQKVEHSKHTNDDKVRCIERLAATLVMENKIEEAVHLYSKSLHIVEQTYGADNAKLVPTLFALGSIYESEGDHKSAMRFYNRAVAINEKSYGPQSPAFADSLHRLGHANYGAGQIKEAESNYKSSLAILMQQPSLSSSKQLESLLNDYSDLLKKNDNSDKALLSDFDNELLKDRHQFPVPAGGVPPSAWQKEIQAQSSQSKQRQNNEEEQVLLRGFSQPFDEKTLKPAYQTMSEVLHGQHPYAQGEEYYQRTVAIDIKALGPNHPSVADDLTALSLLYISQQRYAEAKPLLERALAIYQSVYGSDNLLVTRTRDYLASVYDKLGDTQKATALYDQAIRTGHVVLDPNNLETARMLNQLAYLYYSQGKLDDACTVYAWALASTKAAVGEQNILVAACMTDYAHALRSSGRIAEAIQMENQVRMIKLSHVGDRGVEESYHE